MHPDIVLTYHATNDLAEASRQAAIHQGIIKDDSNVFGSPVIQFLSEQSLAFDLIYKNIKILLQKGNTADSRKLSKFPQAYTSSFIANLDSIRQECQKFDVPLVVLTFSTKFRCDQPKEQQSENMNIVIVKYYMPWMTPDLLFEGFSLYNREMFEFAQLHPEVYVDTLHNIIPGDNEHFVDSVHFADKGSRAMADRVFNALLRQKIISDVLRHRKESNVPWYK